MIKLIFGLISSVSDRLERRRKQIAKSVKEGLLKPSGLTNVDASAVLVTVLKDVSSPISWLQSLPKMGLTTGHSTQDQTISFQFLQLVHKSTFLTSELASYPIHTAFYTGKE